MPWEFSGATFKARTLPNVWSSIQPASVTNWRFIRVVFWCSAALYLVGCFTAYVLGPLLVRFDS